MLFDRYIYSGVHEFLVTYISHSIFFSVFSVSTLFSTVCFYAQCSYVEYQIILLPLHIFYLKKKKKKLCFAVKRRSRRFRKNTNYIKKIRNFQDTEYHLQENIGIRFSISFHARSLLLLRLFLCRVS